MAAVNISQKAADLFPTDLNAIIARVSQIDPVLYSQSRNYVDGAVTYLSPYISRGVINIRDIQNILLGKGFNPGEKIFQELAWREYYQRVWQAKGDALFEDLRSIQTDVAHYDIPEAITNATTGIDAIDEHVRKLYDTGYVHNHVRMYVASIACNVGKTHWSAPAKWMYYHLLDGDLASNTCSWQWVAGTFASKKYYCNQDNINHFTHHTQHQTFLDAPVETLSGMQVPPVLKSTVVLNLKTNLPATEAPSIDVNKPTLVYNGYNLDPFWRKDEDVNRILLLEPSHFERYPVSEKVLYFIIDLARNIPGCQIVVAEISALQAYYKGSGSSENCLISKEHPAYKHYPGIKDGRDWIYPEVTGYYNSFSAFWKTCRKVSS